MEPLDTLIQAGALGKRGWRVFPVYGMLNGTCACGAANCSSPAKHPKIFNWQKRAASETGDLAMLSPHWQNANVGLVTGASSGIVVLDIDQHDPTSDGEESLRQLQIEYGELPTTVQVLTGRGRQLYFRHPGGEVKGAVGIRPGLDLRADGNYVVAPGSTHQNGKRYEFEVSHHPDDTPLAEIPQWLLILQEEKKPGQAETRLVIPEQITEGSRHVLLFKLACSLRERGLLEESISQALLTENALRCTPPLEKEEALGIAIDVCKRYSSGDFNRRTAAEMVKDRAVKVFKAVPFSQIAPKQVEWLIQGHVPVKGITLVSAMPKFGKSFIGAHMAVCLASGLRLFGVYETKQTEKILLVNLEDDPSTVTRARLDAFLRAEALDETILNQIVTIEDQFCFDNDPDRQSFRTFIQNEGIKVMILDPFLDFAGTAKVRDETEIGVLLGFLRALTKEFGIAVVFMHHESKNRSSYDNPASFSLGSVQFDRVRDVGMYLSRENDINEPLSIQIKVSSKMGCGQFYGVHLRSEGHESNPDTLRFEWFNPELDRMVDGKVKEGTARLAIMAAIRKAGVPLSSNRICELARDEGASMSQGNLRKLIKSMVELETLKKQGEGYVVA
jgi:hypothetical protein